MVAQNLQTITDQFKGLLEPRSSPWAREIKDDVFFSYIKI